MTSCFILVLRVQHVTLKLMTENTMSPTPFYIYKKNKHSRNFKYCLYTVFICYISGIIQFSLMQLQTFFWNRGSFVVTDHQNTARQVVASVLEVVCRTGLTSMLLADGTANVALQQRGQRRPLKSVSPGHVTESSEFCNHGN